MYLLGHATSKALSLLLIGPGAGAEFECSVVGEEFQAKHPRVLSSSG